MLVQVNTDNHVHGSAELTSEVETIVQDKLERFANRITRVEVTLTDENSSAKSGPKDLKCVVEARLSGLQPISVSDLGDSKQHVVLSAINKMERLIESTLGKLADR